MAKKIENLGRWAEKHFSALCSEAGVTANKSEEDEMGWDYLLEFPAEIVAKLPPDLQKTERAARAQVKSRKRGKLVANLKLSNARRFAAAPEPCFVILAAAIDGCHPVEIYAKHFWKEDISRTLKRLREADHKATPLHKQTFSIGFTEFDKHTDDLLTWMRRIISDGGRDYAAEKRKLNENLGYEDGRFFGTITFYQKDLATFIDHSIGLEPKIELTNAKLVDRRFGIDAKTPIFDGKPTYAHMRSHPKPCSIEITDAEDQVHNFDGERFGPGLPGLPLEMAKARIVAAPFEVILEGAGRARFNYHFNSGDRHKYEHLLDCLRLLSSFGKGPMHFALLFDGRRIEAGPVTVQESNLSEYLPAAIAFLDTLALVRAKAGNPDIELALDDLLLQWDSVLEFCKQIEAESLNLSLDASERSVSEAKIVRLISGVTLLAGETRFTALLASKVEDDRFGEGERKLTFTKPVLVSAIVDKRDKAAHCVEVQKQLRRYAERHGEGVITINRAENGDELSVVMVNPPPHK